MTNAMTTMVRTEGVVSLYKGLIPTLVGIAPYAALNFASYDLLKRYAYSGGAKQSPVANLLLGGLAGTVAATVCYPLDTIRRRMQMRGVMYTSQVRAGGAAAAAGAAAGAGPSLGWPSGLLPAAAALLAAALQTTKAQRQASSKPSLSPPVQANAFATIWRTEGAVGFYRGWAANTIKVVPQNAMRFVSYELLKGLLGVHKAKTDT